MNFDVLDADDPFLLELYIMDKRRLVTETVEHVLIGKRYGWKLHIIRNLTVMKLTGTPKLIYSPERNWVDFAEVNDSPRIQNNTIFLSAPILWINSSELLRCYS